MALLFINLSYLTYRGIDSARDNLVYFNELAADPFKIVGRHNPEVDKKQVDYVNNEIIPAIPGIDRQIKIWNTLKYIIYSLTAVFLAHVLISYRIVKMSTAKEQKNPGLNLFGLILIFYFLKFLTDYLFTHYSIGKYSRIIFTGSDYLETTMVFPLIFLSPVLFFISLFLCVRRDSLSLSWLIFILFLISILIAAVAFLAWSFGQAEFRL